MSPRAAGWALVALLASAALVACSDTPLPPPGQLDGSFLVGDAPAAPDAVARDGAPRLDGALDGGTDLDGDLDDGGPTGDGAIRDGAVISDGGPTGDAGPPDPCTATASVTVTATAALARAAELDGWVVDVVATATLAAPDCTAAVCAPEAPCCNTCSAEVRLDGQLPLRAGRCAPRVGCSGDECNLVCTPPVLGFPQTFRGVVRSAPTPGLELMRVLP